ncbi:unnamed protein product [Rhizophagus irregularis]|nr:unnamed protein product [Rhizophagus irregularis]
MTLEVAKSLVDPSINVNNVRTTGKYLSSNNYSNGRYGCVVTLSNNQSDPYCQWQIIGQSLNFNDEIHYGNKIQLKNQMTNRYLYSANGYKSPATNHQLVFTNSYVTTCNWIVQFGNSVDYNGMWKLNDKFSLLCEIGSAKSLLRAHDFHFNIEDKNFQEVVCHNERFGGNDEWCIEFF